MSICFRLKATTSVSMVNFIAMLSRFFPVNAFFLFEIHSFGVVCYVFFNFGTITKRTKTLLILIDFFVIIVLMSYLSCSNCYQILVFMLYSCFRFYYLIRKGA